jgi:hypothetical protein
MKFLLKLPWMNLKAILDDNKLNIKEERILINLLEKFLDHRKDLPIPKEDDPKLKTDNLTQAELDARALLKEEEQKTKDADAEAKKTADEAARAALTTDQEKIDWDQKKIQNGHHAKAADNLKIKKLSKAEQRNLFQCVRYNFLSHEDLIELSSKAPWNSVAKDYIVEGLSYRLNQF